MFKTIGITVTAIICLVGLSGGAYLFYSSQDSISGSSEMIRGSKPTYYTTFDKEIFISEIKKQARLVTLDVESKEFNVSIPYNTTTLDWGFYKQEWNKVNNYKAFGNLEYSYNLLKIDPDSITCTSGTSASCTIPVMKVEIKPTLNRQKTELSNTQEDSEFWQLHPLSSKEKTKVEDQINKELDSKAKEALMQINTPDLEAQANKNAQEALMPFMKKAEVRVPISAETTETKQ